ncbi:MAG: type III ribulose-bisphosphate carboxylase [Candidatus Aenigmarchaeota archaeon]|nr:type III ribulose-bisphosphate carboxylase [Candidatus Aenigmarchaeota archaeon]
MAGYEDFVQLDYKPSRSDLIVSSRIRVPSWSTWKRAAGAVGSESSVGTWAESVVGLKYAHVQRVAAKIFSARRVGNEYVLKIAYPQDHFEMGNMSQILASIAGNVFGMKAVESLRIDDIRWTRDIIRSFPGPKFGIDGIRKFMKVKKRPLMLSVPKPKVGMTTDEHCQIGHDIWLGGLDLLKDDENLSNQKFNLFKNRVAKCMKIRDRIERQTGDRKSYLINVTHSDFREMERRARFVADLGWEFAMIDVVTCGFSGVHSLRNLCGDLGLAIHAHRAMHGAFTRVPSHGFSMLALGEVVRLLGVDQLHIGTAGVGKLVGGRKEVVEIEEHIAESPHAMNEHRSHLTFNKVKANRDLNTLDEDWLNVKPVLPVTSGGIHPGIVEPILDRMGIDIAVQIGGGIHGHPKGSYAGAVAMRASIEAYMDKQNLEEKAKGCKELQQALDKWGHERTR